MQKVIRILGTHNVPAAQGGFETVAEKMAQQRVAQGLVPFAGRGAGRRQGYRRPQQPLHPLRSGEFPIIAASPAVYALLLSLVCH
jgi:hypothetical protein